MDVDTQAADSVRKLLGFDVRTARFRLSALGTLLKGGSIDPACRADLPYEEIVRMAKSITARMTAAGRTRLVRLAKVVADEGLHMNRLLTHWGPERLAAIAWTTALDALSAALSDFLPRAEVRCQEHTRLSGWAGNGPSYQAMRDNTRALLEGGMCLARQIAKAKGDLEYDRGISLPGLEKRDGRSSLARLALTEGRLRRAGLAPAEIAVLVPDNHAPWPSDERRTAKDHRERIRKRVESVAEQLDAEERVRARGRALARRMATHHEKRAIRGK